MSRPAPSPPLEALRPRAGWALAVCLLVLSAGGASAQRAYHFSPSGHDARGEGSATQPWASVERANALDLEPGDSLLFEGGAAFQGGLVLDAADAGTPGRPVVVGSYGDGRATLDGGAGTAVYVYNAGGVEVRGLVVRGSGVTSNSGTGVAFYTDLPGDVRLAHVRIDGVEAHGFGGDAFLVGSWNGRTGYRDVRVTRVEARASRNGMRTFAQEVGGIEGLYVGHSRFYDNPGVAGASQPTGSGLVVSGVRGALVERNLAYGNGAANTYGAGPVGIWAYEADSVAVRHNESYGNRTRGGDGGGFDLDGGVTNSVVEYNYSHDNDGAGFGLFQYAGARPSGGNVVRYNVSENDGRRGGYGAISVWGASPADPVGSADVYHNTVYVSPAPRGLPSAVEFKNANHESIAFRNNLFVTSGGVPLVEGPADGDVRFEGNAYWSSGARFDVRWGGTTYASLEAWRRAVGQEQVDGTPVGTAGDPLLRAAGAGGAVGDPNRLASLEAYQLLPASPLAAAALALEPIGVNAGPMDFYGTPLPSSERRAVGAHQPVPEAGTSDGTVGTVQGPVEHVDPETETIRVASVRVQLTGSTVVRDAAGVKKDREDLQVGLAVDVTGVVLPGGGLRADSVTVVGQAAALQETERGAAPSLDVVAVAPNPTAGWTTLVLDLPEPGPLSVTVFDTLGRAVLQLPHDQLSGGPSHVVRLDLSTLPGGVYLVRVTSRGGLREAVATAPVTVVR